MILMWGNLIGSAVNLSLGFALDAHLCLVVGGFNFGIFCWIWSERERATP